MKNKEKKKNSLWGSLEHVDTTELNLQQLQDFCVQVHRESIKAEVECRGLEIEKNKLKTMKDIAEKQLIKSKQTQRNSEYQREEQKVKFLYNEMETTNCLRNMWREIAQGSSEQLLETYIKVQQLAQTSLEEVSEIKADIKIISNTISNNDTSLTKYIQHLEMKLDENKSSMIEHFETNKRLFASQHKKMSKEYIKHFSDESLKSQQHLISYKTKNVNLYLRNNDKMFSSLRHHYEKIQQHNTMILENLHEKYKLVKDNVKYLEVSAKVHKENVDGIIHEIIENSEKKLHLDLHLADSKKIRSELQQTQQEKNQHQRKAEDLRWDSLFLEEALIVKKKMLAEEKIEVQDAFLKLQLKIIEQLVLLDKLIQKITLQLSIIEQVIEFAKTKRAFLGQKLTGEQIKDLALCSLEQFADSELQKDQKRSIAYAL